MNYVGGRVLRVLPVLTRIAPRAQSKELAGQRKP
jgi:hypothetical protein